MTEENKGKIAEISEYQDKLKADKHQEERAMASEKDYLDARLEAVQGRIDERLAAMKELSADADKRLHAALDRSDNNKDKLEKRMELQTTSILSDNKQTRWTLVAIAVAIIVGVAGSNWAMVTAFQQTVSEQGAWMRQSVERIESRSERIESLLLRQNSGALTMSDMPSELSVRVTPEEQDDNDNPRLLTDEEVFGPDAQ